jgi:uncharacterized protein YbaP (TraB family)
MENVDQMGLAVGLMAGGMYPEGQTVFDNIDNSLAELLCKAVSTVAVPIEVLERMRPWLLAMILDVSKLESLGYQEEHGIDGYFTRLAASRGLNIGELETAEEQLSVFEDFAGDDDGVKFLQATLMGMDKVEEDMVGIFEAWTSGDVAAFEDISFEIYREHPELTPVMDRLIIQRNVTMTDRLAPYLNSPEAPAFVVVGAAHLVGPRGILAQFRSLGYTVEQH